MEGTPKNDSLVLERLARMEEQLKQVTDIKQSIDQLNVQLVNLNNVYLTRTESQMLNMVREEQLRNFEAKIDAQDARIKKLESAGGWVIKTVGAIIIVALLSLVVIKGGQ